MAELPNVKGLLVLPRLRIQNVNAISAPMTWGFPSMTAFMGLMWALERALNGRYPLVLNACGVVCHAFEPQVSKGGFTKSFCLTRNPVGKDGGSASIIEEGRTHLDLTLVFGVVGGLLTASSEEQEAALKHIADLISRMRVAGGTVLPGPPFQRPELIALADNDEERRRQFRRIRRTLLPGFCLVERHDLLEARHRQMRDNNAEATLLDAWLDLSRINWSASVARNDAGAESVSWRHDRANGWIVPIPLGYAALTDVQDPGTVMNARDTATPFRFVEAVYGIGQWIGPHRLVDACQMFWYPSTDEQLGLYRCCNDYVRFS
ncbi:MAG: type I-F CRISPR-associated protein Csy2 [Desulfobulbus sp.]|jgi:CRISPR-associated protein Csy2|uniref:type I-F CRISPR-associated protein Csy2 n=1 Tax=Desulfobulbus sp. TaxID=895 RepID=UPI00283EC22A|nr:type I-F CRISPR-associated protein Csy2 [Desulfobulbus sp.]MDR2549038.1 type I-F CRISPR-associated protein Csy2 [Desulfobulbus sp.]